jgi:hypothetical protein
MSIESDAATVDGKTPPVEDLTTGKTGDQDTGAEAEDSPEAIEAMMAGWKHAGRSTNADVRTPKEENISFEGEDLRTPKEDEQVDETDPGAKPAGNGERTVDEDPDVTGLGMKRSEVLARLGKLETLEKSVASTAGHLGHLKTLLSGSKGQPLTADKLKRIESEFGKDYAEALAEDLNAAGFGSAGFSDEALGKIVDERVGQATAAVTAERDQLTAHLRRVETREVLRVHSDAKEYFSGGKHNADFLAFVKTLPAERQQELSESWDADVIAPALTEFKARQEQVTKEKTKQNQRIALATVPTRSASADVKQPVGDPIEAGWNAVKGRKAGGGR